mmetsp:Transcript_100130/g.322733  ORF Transcript_100130/g.322733 Transcript_100130/m.322733 type:complete len:366 (+) Transcript_100130:709-1806(+)
MRNLAQVYHCELPHESSGGVLLDERRRRHVEHQRVVRGESDAQTPPKEGGKRVARVREEERVVRDRRHRHADLGDVVEVFEGRLLGEVDAVGDVLRKQEGGREVVHGANLAAMRAQGELPQALGGTKLVEGAQVDPEVKVVVAVRRVLLGRVLGRGGQRVELVLVLNVLVVHGVDDPTMLEEPAELDVVLRTESRVEQWPKEVAQHLSKRRHIPSVPHVVYPKHLHSPQQVLTDQALLVCVNPLGERLPLRALPALDRDPWLQVDWTRLGLVDDASDVELEELPIEAARRKDQVIERLTTQWRKGLIERFKVAHHHCIRHCAHQVAVHAAGREALDIHHRLDRRALLLVENAIAMLGVDLGHEVE